MVVDVTSRPDLPTALNLGRVANAYSHKTRARNPTGLEFEIQYEHMPPELQEEGTTKDIIVDGRRHIVVSTHRKLKDPQTE